MPKNALAASGQNCCVIMVAVATDHLTDEMCTWHDRGGPRLTWEGWPDGIPRRIFHSDFRMDCVQLKAFDSFVELVIGKRDATPIQVSGLKGPVLWASADQAVERLAHAKVGEIGEVFVRMLAAWLRHWPAHTLVLLMGTDGPACPDHSSPKP